MKRVSLGAGLRTGFWAAEDQARTSGNKWSNNFALNNLRLYLNAQIHKYIKLEFNTECSNCGDSGDIRILDGVGN
jgi:hypothetical protein